MQNRFYVLALLAIFFLAACSKDPDGGTTPEMTNNVRLPQFWIDTNGATIVDEPKIDAQMVIVEERVETYRGAIGIEIRGSSSQQFPKKSFGFETRDEANEDIDVSLLGFPEEEDWVLYAPYSDKSLVRNHLIYELSNDIGRYASRTKFADVFISTGTYNYNGIYVFMEKLKRDDNRIDINKLKEDENSGEDLTGGYIIKLDKADGPIENAFTEINSFPSNFDPPNSEAGQQIHFLYDDPDQDDITPEQKAYISGYMGDFEAALASDEFADPELGYRKYIDTGSFIDFFLLTEISNNVDGYRLSTWITKDKNEKLKMGPIWDFNLAFGNVNYCGGNSTDVWAYRFNERCPTGIWLIPFWWHRLLEDPAFVAQLQDRWSELRGSTFSENYILDKIDGYVAQMRTSGSIDHNFSIWPVLGMYIWPNNYVGQTHDEEIDYLVDWINARLNWLDGAIAGL